MVEGQRGYWITIPHVLTSGLYVEICCCEVFVLRLFLFVLHVCVCVYMDAISPVCVCAGLLDQIYQGGSLPVLRTIPHPRPVLASEATKVTGPSASRVTRGGEIGPVVVIIISPFNQQIYGALIM